MSMKLRRGTTKRLHSKRYDKDYYLEGYAHYMNKMHAYSRKTKHITPVWVEI